MRRFSRAVAVAVVAILIVSGVGPVAAQSDAQPASNGDRRCFPSGGHELGIGTNGPGIAVTIHTSLFTNLGGAGALGIEARGSALNSTIIGLQTGVVFDGVGSADSFLSNPFSRFGILYDYSFQLPMFSGMVDDPGYESDESPVKGVDSRSC
ncbi:hypothetical protein GL213_11630 [Halogeometricum borinquense]|uniref:Uncharacterized protein n=1 Tax=Halogeometricum borinquense TaxID=60847 RepID=A0A6C0UGU7_9EURY|nr:hypothetical protein [Halogeometricum borinquense]QIB73481.1 hypothetical protein G3I44_03780 [Halogeometricum borinquense]QIQ77117.1 hypothetical protein GL213_11630 [Halogeometricum borinquense]